MPVNWNMIAAFLERWNPRSHTFFLPVGEMTIFMNEVESFTWQEFINVAEYVCYPTYIDSPLMRNELLKRLCLDEGVFRSWLIEEGRNRPCIDLKKMWGNLVLGLESSDGMVVRRSRVGLLVCIYGVLFFNAGFDRISLDNAALVIAHFWGSGRDFLSQAILSYTYAGLDACTQGEQFVGSPCLVMNWLKGHFPMSDFDLSLERLEYRWYFDVVEDEDVHFPPECRFITITEHEENILMLIGAHYFTLYSPLRCTRQLLPTFVIPGPLPSVEPAEFRFYWAPGEDFFLQHALLSWQNAWEIRRVPQYGRHNEREEYFDWLFSFIPKSIVAFNNNDQ